MIFKFDMTNFCPSTTAPVLKEALQRGLAENHSSISDSEFTKHVDDHCFVRIIYVLQSKINLSLIISNLVYVLAIINADDQVCDIFGVYILKLFEIYYQ